MRVRSEWVDRLLLAGPGSDTCLQFGSPVDRAGLRELVAQRQDQLAAAGLAAGGTVALRLPPSLAYVTALLAAWRLGAQVSLLDHRLTRHEIDVAVRRLAPQVLVEPAEPVAAGMRGYAEVTPVVVPLADGRPAGTGHALIQLSSGSTGPSKVIARTAADLAAELDRYDQLAGYPGRGSRIVLLASIVHVLGLVGGLLYALHAGVRLVLPGRLTPDGILAEVAAAREPTMLLGVPFHAQLLTAVARPPALPQLVRMVVAGELTRPGAAAAFRTRYGVPLGSMYGMTERGVIATDLSGEHAPALDPAPGMWLRVVGGELQVATAASPYLGLTDPTRWSDGWLRTRDAAALDAATGRVTILGRLDSQVAIGGLKVDLTEVEQTLVGLPAVAEGVLVFDGGIEAYLVLADGATAGQVEQELATRLAPYKRPRQLNVVAALPRTATGKIVRDPAALRTAAAPPGPPASS